MTGCIEHQFAAAEHRLLEVRIILVLAKTQLHTPQQRPYALDQQAHRERFGNVVVGAHLEANQLINLVVLGGEEDHRHTRLATQPGEHLQTVHARHLNIKHRQVRRLVRQTFQSLLPVRIGADGIALCLKSDTDRGQYVLVVVDNCDSGCHAISSLSRGGCHAASYGYRRIAIPASSCKIWYRFLL